MITARKSSLFRHTTWPELCRHVILIDSYSIRRNPNETLLFGCLWSRGDWKFCSTNALACSSTQIWWWNFTHHGEEWEVSDGTAYSGNEAYNSGTENNPTHAKAGFSIHHISLCPWDPTLCRVLTCFYSTFHLTGLLREYCGVKMYDLYFFTTVLMFCTTILIITIL